MIDQTAAAYGIFQLAFAEAEELIGALLCHVRCPENPESELARMRRKPLSRMLKALCKEMYALKGRAGSTGGYAAQVCKAAAYMKVLSQWRNSRVHPHVRRSDSGAYQLFNRDTGQILSMNEAEITEKIDCALQVSSAVISYGGKLLDGADWMREAQRDIEEAFSE